MGGRRSRMPRLGPGGSRGARQPSDRRRDRRRAPRTPDRLGDRHAAASAALDRRGRARPRRPQSLGPSRPAAGRPALRAHPARRAGPPRYQTPRAHSARGAPHSPHRRSSVAPAGNTSHVAVDDYSRAAYVEVLPDQTGRTAAGFLRRTVGWFARRGIAVGACSPITAAATSAVAFARWRAAVACASRARAPIARKPTAKPNDSSRRSFAAGPIAVSYPSSWRRTLALRPWLRHYNVERPHAALGYQPPCVRFPRVAQ